MSGIFDPIEMREILENKPYGFRLTLNKGLENLADPASPLWTWSSATFGNVPYGYFCGVERSLLVQAQAVVASAAAESIRRAQWRAHRKELDKPRALELCGPIVTHIDVPESPLRWIPPNLVLLGDHWLRTGQIDTERLAIMWSTPMAPPPFRGVLSALDVTSLSAWEQIIAMQGPPVENGAILSNDATERLALALAEDPSQLHDSKSPVRKKARSLMLRRMSNDWLARGHATTAMNWLWTFEWREGQSGLSPEDVMLRAYAFMPDVEPPPNIATKVTQLRKIPV